MKCVALRASGTVAESGPWPLATLVVMAPSLDQPDRGPHVTGALQNVADHPLPSRRRLRGGKMSTPVRNRTGRHRLTNPKRAARWQMMSARLCQAFLFPSVTVSVEELAIMPHMSLRS
jgi:hypothetical protein